VLSGTAISATGYTRNTHRRQTTQKAQR